jgi:Tfp pilus assembly protein PilN
LSLAQKKVALPEDEKTINILPQTLVDQYKKAAEESQERKVNLLAVIILLLLDFVVLLTFFQTKLRIDSLSKDSLLKENSAKISSLENHRQDIILVNQIFLQNDLFRKVVTGFWQAKDQPVILSGLSFSETKGEIFFSGKANSRQDLLTFKDNLEKSDLFAKVSIPFSSLGEESNVDFKIILKLK